MQDLLFLTHRIPYPPDKGDKIRAWNVLRHLTRTYRIHLATFIDAPEDVRHVDKLKSICSSVFCQGLNSRIAKVHSLRSLFRGTALTEGYFGSMRFAAGVRDIIHRYKPAVTYAFCSAMIPYIPENDGSRIILDLVDVDSEKWRQYAAASSGVARWVYAREGRTVLELERRGAQLATAVLLVSQSEADLFATLAPESVSKIHAVSNGVDTEYFNPALSFPNPFGTETAIVFTGLMSYRPNIEAMSWFVHKVMPLLEEYAKKPMLWIVGADPSEAVRSLSGPKIRVTGRVPDIRPYLRYAGAVVAPLQIGRGIQNKVLEAMAMGAPVVVTPAAREGLDQCGNEEMLVASSANEFASAVVDTLEGRKSKTGPLARARVVKDYQWNESLKALDRLLPSAGASPVSPSLIAV